MKKISLLIVSVLLLSACTHKNTTQNQPEQEQTQNEMAQEFENIATAIAAGKSAQCVMTKTDSTDTITTYIKGKKVKTIAVSEKTPAQNGSMLSDGTTMYTWTDATKEGVMFKLPSEDGLKNIPTNAPQVPDFSKPEETEKFENQGYTVNCEVKNIDDAEFTKPADVTFTDMSAFLENAAKMAPPSAQ